VQGPALRALYDSRARWNLTKLRLHELYQRLYVAIDHYLAKPVAPIQPSYVRKYGEAK